MKPDTERENEDERGAEPSELDGERGGGSVRLINGQLRVRTGIKAGQAVLGNAGGKREN